LVWQRRHELTPIFKDPSSDLLLLGVLIVIGHFLNSAEFWVVYRATNIRIGFFENWMVFTSGLLGNLLPGQMGTLYKFRYMKQVHQLPYAKSGSNYGANLIISLGSSAIVGIVGVFGNKISSGSFSWVMLLCFIGLGIVCIATLRLSLPTWKFLRGKPAKIFSSFNEGWDEIRRTPRTTFQVIAIDVVKYLVTAWRFQIAFGLLGYHQSFWYFLVIAPAAAIAGIIAFTPGGLGIRELFVTGAALAMGSSFDTGLLAATTDRGAMLASAVVLGSIGFLYSAPRLRRATTTQPTPTDV
jgi:uncharacterized membrane protein YbhN (UPF0104 family)